MISSVFLSGRLGKVLPNGLRIVEVDRVLPLDGGKYVTDYFKVRSMLNETSSFYRGKEGCLVIIKGRLEMDEKEGLIIIGELEEVFSLPEKMQKFVTVE